MGEIKPLALLAEIGKASVGCGICIRFSRMVRSRWVAGVLDLQIRRDGKDTTNEMTFWFT